jgi:acetyl esterase/lipase
MKEVSHRVRPPVLGAVMAGVVTAVASSVLFVPATSAGAHDAPPPTPPATTLAAVRPGRTTVTYCDDGGVPETLDVYEPNPLPSTRGPAVVYVHGGGWVAGDSTITSGSVVGQIARAIEAKGWVFVSIDYRLAPRFRWPAQIDDAACAIRFLRAASSALHIDPSAIGAMGDSAGGQIVSLLGLGDSAAGIASGPYAGQSTAVQAVVDLYGPADLTTTDWAHAALIQDYAVQAFGTTFGPGIPGASTTALLAAASPVTYIAAHAPPFLVVQGEQDTVVPPDQSVELATRLRETGDSVTLVLVQHAQHGLLPAGGPVAPGVTLIAAQAAAFLVHHLQPLASHAGTGHPGSSR